MSNEKELLKASPRVCKVLDMVIDGLMGDAEGAVAAKHFDIAYAKIIIIDELMGFKQMRCGGN